MYADGLPNVLLPRCYKIKNKVLSDYTVNYLLGPQILSGTLIIPPKRRFELKPTENDPGPQKYFKKVDCNAYIFRDFTFKVRFWRKK